MSKVRERILDVATNLFYRQGIQAVGVDAIISTAEVARMSFYRHFRSKEGLALAVLERRDERLRAWFEQEVERLAPDANLRPLAVFDALAMRLASPDYRGCVFLNTIAETPLPSHALHRAAAAHKHRFEAYFARLLRAAGLDESAASALMLLFDGAVVTAVREGNPTPATRAKKMAARVLGIAPAN
ncbi:TetR/AcrR family transcriptional regulator [Xanthomonas campestris pv. raphani]|uniref:TetR/AcrR family transcriptional regulator n=1 Tax=Xanthomonas campestris TaxID=339 RepID=UPI002B23993F|nr:TetR/AcrR family transcriptional regulator [Xanthomonas campestris]MEA9787081.1 TetR/AcrR family transcriptional regulator [Xanthomonas campestris pv. raphani]